MGYHICISLAQVRTLLSIPVLYFPFLCSLRGEFQFCCAFIFCLQVDCLKRSTSACNPITEYWGIYSLYPLGLISLFRFSVLLFFLFPSIFPKYTSFITQLCVTVQLGARWYTGFWVLIFFPYLWIIASNLGHWVDPFYSTTLQTTALRQSRGTEMSPGWEQEKAPEKCMGKWATFRYTIGFV